MQSTLHATTDATVLSQDDDILYEVVDNDVAFVSYERWSRQRPVPCTEAWEVVPNLVVEVISPSEKGNDILNKVAEYFRIGVECVWVIFISQEQVYIYESPTQVRILTRADELYGEPVLPHFRLPLAALCEDIEATELPQQTVAS